MPAPIADIAMLPGNPTTPVSDTDGTSVSSTPESPGGAALPTAFGQLMAALATGAKSTAGATGAASPRNSLAPASPTSPAGTGASPVQPRPSRTPPGHQTRPAAISSDLPVHNETPHPVDPDPVTTDALSLPLPVESVPVTLHRDVPLRVADAVVEPGSGMATSAASDPVHAGRSTPAPTDVAAPAAQPPATSLPQPDTAAVQNQPIPPAPAPAPRAAHDAAPSARAPAAQVAPVLLSLARSPAGAQHLTIRLDPPELGSVQIRLERTPDMPPRVEISVQRPETLGLLMRDQPQLQHALDQAGVPVEGRHVVFQLDPQDRSDTAGQSDAQHRGTPGSQSPHHRKADPDEAAIAPADAARWLRAGLDITA